MLNIKSPKVKLFILISITLGILISIINGSLNVNHIGKTKPVAKNGVIDLRDWDLNKDGMIKLDGQWEFYSNQLLTPKDFVNESINKSYSSIPGVFGGYGYGTYRLKILVNSDDYLYSTKIDFIQNAYTLWANNRQISSVGKVGKSQNEMIPQLLPKTASFYTENGEVYLTLQVSNFYTKFGFIDTILMGEASTIDRYKEKKIAFDLFLLGSTVIAAIYNLAVFFKRKKDKAPLYFALVCILVAVRTMFLGERFLIVLFPYFSYIISGKIRIWTFYLYIPLIVLFIHKTYGEILSKRVVQISNFSAFLYFFIVLLSPAQYYIQLIVPFEVLALLMILYMMWKISKVYIETGTSDYIAVVGLFALFITRINDILYEYSIIITNSFAPLGIFIFIIANYYVLAERQSKAFSDSENMIEKLKAINNLRDEIDTLTLENSESTKKVEELMEYNKLKTEFFTNISHELKTPLNVICSTIQLLNSLDESKELGDERIKYYFSIMNQNSLRLLRLINNLIDTTKVDGNYINLNLINGNIIYVVEELVQSVADFVKSKGISIVFDTEIEEKVIAFDEEKIERIILNLLSNAVKFTDTNGNVYVNIYEKKDSIEISIRDTGIGIPKDKLEFIFERFAQIDKSTTRKNEGSGIGLSLVKSLIEMHGGSIFVKSELGKGSEFTVNLPSKILNSDEIENDLINKEFPKSKYEENLKIEFSDIYL